MARYVVTVTTTVAASGYAQPARLVPKGAVVELSASEVTAIGAGNLRAVTSSTAHDQLGESAGISNGSLGRAPPMTAVLPHYKTGPANYQAAGLIFGGQFVVPNTLTAGTTDLTVAVAPGGESGAATGVTNVLGVAGTDANVISTQTGAANAYGEPLIDISVLGDYVSVYYGGIDIWVWYAGAAKPGDLLVVGSATSSGAAPGAVTGTSGTAYFPGTSTTITVAPANVVGRCTHPGGVSSGMLTQQIGGTGTAQYFLGRARVF